MNPNTDSPGTPRPPSQSGSHGINQLTLISMAVFVLMALGVIIFLYYQNQQLKSMLAKYQTPATSPTPSATDDPTASWKTYTNNAGYSIKYPSSFRTEVIAAEGQNEADASALGLFIYQIGSSSPYEERYINLETVQLEPTYSQGTIIQTTLNGYTAKKITISTAPFDIYSIKINKGQFIEIYVSNNPDRKNVADQILSTFKFISPTPSPTPPQKACTLEAKICPNGTSVGRTGPNCDFAPCPTPY